MSRAVSITTYNIHKGMSPLNRRLQLPQMVDALQHLDTDTLLICWSAKETAFKMMRKRAVDWRNDLQIVSFDPQLRRLSIRETLTPHATLCSIGYIATPEFIMTQSVSQ